MAEKKCKECSNMPFFQCRDNPCREKSFTDCIEYKKQDFYHSSNCNSNLINLDESMVNRLFGHDRVSTLNELLCDGISIDSLGIKNERLLIWACRNGYRDLVELLIKNGADPFIRCNTYYCPTALSHAVCGDCIHVIDMLVGCGYRINEEFFGHNYLFHAINLNKPKMVKCLLHWGFDINSNNEILYQLLTVSLVADAKILELLLSHGIKIEKGTFYQVTLAERIIRTERSDLLEVIIKQAGLDFCEKYQYTISGYSLLHIAANQSNSNCLEYLLKLGLNPNIHNLSGQETPLHIATKTHLKLDSEIIPNLLLYEATTEARDCYGNTALHNAVTTRKYDAVRSLLYAGTRFDLLNKNGKTAVDLAIENDEENIIDWLLLFGANVSKIEKLINDEGRHRMVRAILVRHKIKLKTANLIKNFNVVMDQELCKFENDCLKEIEKMKNLKTQDGEVIFYNLLRAGKRGLAMIASKWSLKDLEYIFDNFTHSDFPIYWQMFLRNIDTAIKYAQVYSRSVESFDNLIDSVLPILVIEKIIDYLNEEQMKNLIKLLET